MRYKKNKKKGNNNIVENTEANLIEEINEIEENNMEQIVEEAKSIVDLQDDKNKKNNTILGVNEIIYINRDQEDADIIKFQKTGDLILLEKLYKNRIPTLKTWAYQHYYPGLTLSIEDLFEELSIVFIKAANRYDKKRGPFNTCLFTFLLNRVKNIKNSKYAKKRKSEEYEGPLNGMILSLDYSYNDGDGSTITLKDIIANKASIDEETIHRDTNLEEAIKILSKGNQLLKEFLIKLSEGNSVTALLKEYRTKNGKVNISDIVAKKLSKKLSKKIVKEIIKEETNLNNFVILDYKIVQGNSLVYKIELKKTEESDILIKSLRNLKKNKANLMCSLWGK